MTTQGKYNMQAHTPWVHAGVCQLVVVFPLISLCPSVVLTVLYLLNRRCGAHNIDVRSPLTTSTEKGVERRQGTEIKALS